MGTSWGQKCFLFIMVFYPSLHVASTVSQTEYIRVKPVTICWAALRIRQLLSSIWHTRGNTVPAFLTPGGGPGFNSTRGLFTLQPSGSPALHTSWPCLHPPACHSPRPLLEASCPSSWAASTLRCPPFPRTLSATSPCDFVLLVAVIAPEPCPASPKAHRIPRWTRRRPADRRPVPVWGSRKWNGRGSCCEDSPEETAFTPQPRRAEVGLLEGLAPRSRPLFSLLNHREFGSVAWVAGIKESQPLPPPHLVSWCQGRGGCRRPGQKVSVFTWKQRECLWGQKTKWVPEEKRGADGREMLVGEEETGFLPLGELECREVGGDWETPSLQRPSPRHLSLWSVGLSLLWTWPHVALQRASTGFPVGLICNLKKPAVGPCYGLTCVSEKMCWSPNPCTCPDLTWE